MHHIGTCATDKEVIISPQAVHTLAVVLIWLNYCNNFYHSSAKPEPLIAIPYSSNHPSMTAIAAMKTPDSALSLDKNVASMVETKRNKPKYKQSVSFDQIEIREYSRCLGDNPAVTHGPPLSIDWAYRVAGSYDVAEYEENRPKRRGNQEMLVPGSVREDILFEHTNVTSTQIQRTTSEIKTIRHRRQVCVVMQEFEDWAWFGETVARRFRRFRSGISKEQEQKMLWENAQRLRDTKKSTLKLEGSNGMEPKAKVDRDQSDDDPTCDKDGSIPPTSATTSASNEIQPADQ